MHEPADPGVRPESRDAVAAFQAGRRDEAERICHALLAAAPAPDPDALHLLGLIAFQRQRLDEARDLLERAVARRPDPAYNLNLGAARLALGQTAGAADAFRAAAAGSPGLPEARLNLGLAEQALGRPAAAEAALRAALALVPALGAAHAALGVVLQGTERPAEAEAAFARATRLPPETAEAPSNLGVVRRALGRPEAAEAALRVAVARQPERGELYVNLGGLRQAQGDPDAAAQVLARAVRLAPLSLVNWLELGVAERTAGRPDSAAAALRHALALEPGLSDGWSILAGLHSLRGRPADALRAQRRATAAAPDSGTTRALLSTAWQAAGMTAEATAAAHAALALNPAFGEALSNLAALLHPKAREAAATVARRALRIDPANTAALCNLAAVLTETDRQADALPMLRRAVALAPEAAAVPYGNLGAALLGLERREEAAGTLRRAIQLAPEDAAPRSNLASALLGILLATPTGAVEAQTEAALLSAAALDPAYTAGLANLGSLWQGMGRPQDTIRILRRAIVIDPDHVEAHWNLSLSLLQTGALIDGWAAYEWRWRHPELARTEADPPLPRWAGEPVEGRAILLYGEQGLGDMIQFARYAPLLAARGATVHLQVPGPLVRLFGRLPGVASVIAMDAPAPEAAFCCPLMGLPHRFATRLETIPGTFPYLSADPAAAAAWKERLGPDDGRLRVGLVWAGNPRYAVDRQRSIAADRLLPLLRMPGVRLFSLQKDVRPEDAGPLAAAVEEGAVTDLAPQLGDFADTAAALEALDLLVAVDTSAAHLAGALGRPVWALLREPSDWRWLIGREDSPWYPSMRLFRQTVPRDWDDPLARLAGELRRVAEGERGRLRPG